MSDRRMLDEEPDSLAADLFRVASREKPDEAARRRAAIALGLGPSGGGPAGAPPSGGNMAIKWVTAGIVGAAALGLVWQFRTAQPPAVPAPTTSAITALTETAPSLPIAPSLPSAATPPLMEPTAAPIASAAPHAPASAPRAAASSRLAEEVASLDRVRQTLRAGNASGALGELGRHRREFPRGALGMEATVLEIEALAGSGQRAAAASRARALLASHPDGPYAARIREIVPEAQP